VWAWEKKLHREEIYKDDLDEKRLKSLGDEYGMLICGKNLLCLVFSGYERRGSVYGRSFTLGKKLFPNPAVLV